MSDLTDKLFFKPINIGNKFSLNFLSIQTKSDDVIVKFLFEVAGVKFKSSTLNKKIFGSPLSLMRVERNCSRTIDVFFIILSLFLPAPVF